MRQSLESQGWFVEAGALHAACRSDIVVNTVDVRAVIELMIHGLDKSRVVFKQTTFRCTLSLCNDIPCCNSSFTGHFGVYLNRK
jgi:hypothetical protein